MAAHPHRPPVGRLLRWPTLGGLQTIVLALVLFIGIFALRESDPNVGDASEVLFVVPIALLALRFGLRGGLAGGLLGLALIVMWDHFDSDLTIGVEGYLNRGIAFLLLGMLLGTFVNYGRRLEAEISRHFEESLDLLASADLDGWFTRVNPAWERTLGHSPETMYSRPFVEFVHPEDREATIAETAALADGSHETVRFRNRYRAADESYRWLEWSAHAAPSDGLIHAAARDISVQVEAEEQLEQRGVARNEGGRAYA